MGASRSRLTNREALIGIAVIQGWIRLPKDRTWGPGWFLGPSCQPVTTLNADNRRTTLRLARMETCIACAAPVSSNSIGDHIVPRAIGGPDTPDNFIPLCGPCNSSKGTRELLDWLRSRGGRFMDLHPDAMTAYARITYKWLDGRSELGIEAPAFRRWPIAEFYPALPSDRHRELFVQAIGR